jgi:flagellar basal-body rod protein FlgC
MGLLTTLDISASALTAERSRLDTITSNIANSRATRTPDGGPYKRRLSVFKAVPVSDDPFGSVLAGKMQKPIVSEIIEDQRPGVRVYDPGHPDADPDTGMLELPNVSVLEEMVDLMSASRSYEANVTAISATKAMALKALEIGR